MTTPNTFSINMQHVVRELDAHHATSLPLLTEPFRKELLAEANSYKYVPQPEFVGRHRVREQVSSYREILPPGSLFCELKGDLNEEIISKVRELGEESLFKPALKFNEISFQLYEAGSIGITPHRDGESVLNLICIVILTGTSKFAICEDRQRRNPYYLDTTPGNVIFMRAVGYRGGDFQPMHFVTDITERRIAVGIRQILKH